MVWTRVGYATRAEGRGGWALPGFAAPASAAYDPPTRRSSATGLCGERVRARTTGSTHTHTRCGWRAGKKRRREADSQSDTPAYRSRAQEQTTAPRRPVRKSGRGRGRRETPSEAG